MISSCVGVWHLIDTAESDPLEWPTARLFRKCVSVLRSLMKREDFDGWWARIHLPAEGEQPTSGPWSPEAIARDARAAAAQMGVSK